MADNEGKSKHSCIRCGKQIKHEDLHVKNCKKAVEDVDFVKCKICNEKFVALYVHCKKHGLNSEEYEKQYGRLMCLETEKRISERNSKTQQKSNYRNRLKQEGKLEKLQAYNEAVGKKVSEVILASNELREKRSETLSVLNRTDKFRKKASETAKKTSARKDIQEQRSLTLKTWRDNNPDKFAAILEKAHSYKSKPESNLFEWISQNFSQFHFKKNQQFKHSKLTLNKTKRRQLDIFSKPNCIIIEFDGRFHFENIEKWNQLDSVQAKDVELNSLKNEFCIIRVSYDQFSYRTSDYGFNNECKTKIQDILKNPSPGLYLIGSRYKENNNVENQSN